MVCVLLIIKVRERECISYCFFELIDTIELY
jgi:hypothetical protein